MARKTPRNDQIAEVVREEREHARHPLSAVARRSRAQKMKTVVAAMALPTEEKFLEAMRSYGLNDDELKLALEAWREGPS
jgi:hypothetical protein